MKRWISLERRAPSFSCFTQLAIVSILLLFFAATSSTTPIMVPSGKIGPITPPTPKPKRILMYPLRKPTPVNEYPDPALEPPEFTGEFNSINAPVGTYNGYPKVYGQQLRNPPAPPVGVLEPRTISAISARSNLIAYQLSLKWPQYKLLL